MNVTYSDKKEITDSEKKIRNNVLVNNYTVIIFQLFKIVNYLVVVLLKEMVVNFINLVDQSFHYYHVLINIDFRMLIRENVKNFLFNLVLKAVYFFIANNLVKNNIIDVRTKLLPVVINVNDFQV